MTEVLMVSQSADFYPGLRDGENVNDYDGSHVEWTFSLPRSAKIGTGVYRIEFVRTLAEEEKLGSPVLGTKPRRKTGGA
jgi:hypothetical protein